MTRPQVAPYGSWKSPISPDLVASASVWFGRIALDGEDVYWSEMRPSEGGRVALVRQTPDGAKRDVTPQPYNVRTTVHEYGGGAFAVRGGVVYFSNFSDQRLYRMTLDSGPEPLTPAEDFRYADGVIDESRGRMFCVRENHTTGAEQAVNSLVGLDLEGGGPGDVLVQGNDFYSSPRLSPDDSRLAWLTWNHPNMPWDGTELWVGELDDDGKELRGERIAGSFGVSVFQPEWSPDGVLHFVSDRTGWWNLYRWRDGGLEPLCEMEAEFGKPQWGFGMSTYSFESKDRIVCAYNVKGFWSLGILDTETGRLEPVETPYKEIRDLKASPGRAVFFAGSPTEPEAVIDLNTETKEVEVLHHPSATGVDEGYLSEPRVIEFPTEKGLTAYALFYAPGNKDYAAPPGTSPPLIVRSHGGPTAAASCTLSLAIQYWTSRGFAVVDVNYGGSTGYGRAYRERLAGEWGVVDVDDSVNAARYLAEEGFIDGERVAIRGGSAGGYTTLCAVTFRKFFKAGACYYGVSDLERLMLDTHKFESRYLERLIGPYPGRLDLYKERSPINFTDRISCPMIFFQGLDDKVVPPNQTEMIVEALRKKWLPVAYLPFEGEQHGFRKAENIKRALEAEQYFYSRIFGFKPADVIEPVTIENL